MSKEEVLIEMDLSVVICIRYICSVGMSGTSRLMLLLVLQTGLVSGPVTSRL